MVRKHHPHCPLLGKSLQWWAVEGPSWIRGKTLKGDLVPVAHMEVHYLLPLIFSAGGDGSYLIVILHLSGKLRRLLLKVSALSCCISGRYKLTGPKGARFGNGSMDSCCWYPMTFLGHFLLVEVNSKRVNPKSSETLGMQVLSTSGKGMGSLLWLADPHSHLGPLDALTQLNGLLLRCSTYQCKASASHKCYMCTHCSEISVTRKRRALENRTQNFLVSI